MSNPSNDPFEEFVPFKPETLKEKWYRLTRGTIITAASICAIGGTFQIVDHIKHDREHSIEHKIEYHEPHVDKFKLPTFYMSVPDRNDTNIRHDVPVALIKKGDSIRIIPLLKEEE